MSNITSVDYFGNKCDAEFNLIGKKCNSDKFYQHHYYNVYPKFIEYYKNYHDLAMLEIGVENKYSINLWLEYFPNAFIYGLDINVSEEGDKYKIFKADQSKELELLNVASSIRSSLHNKLFLIVDDGSHIPEHQIWSFNLFFDLLLPGGTYIIEDIETSYWSKNGLYSYQTNYGYHHNNSVVEFFKLVIDDINALFLTNENKEMQKFIIQNKLFENTRENISTITFTQNAIIITKKTEEQIKFTKKDYYWKQNL